MIASTKDFPNGWRTVRLGDVARERIQRANSGSEVDVFSVTKHTGFVRSLEYFERQVFSRNTSNYKVVRRGDLAYATIHLDEGSLGILQEADTGIISPMYTVFEADRAHTEPEFLFSLMKLPQMVARYRRIGEGTVHRRKSISFERLERLSFVIPPLPEQRRILAVLDSIDEAIERTEAVIAATERLRDALLHELLTRGVPGWHTQWKEALGIGTIPACWEVVRLGEVAQTITSGSRAWSQYFRPDGALFVRSQNISGGTIDRSDAIFVQPPVDAEAVRTRIHRGDLLVSITGEPGKVTVAGDTLGQAYVSQHVALVRLNDPGLSDFACEFLRGLAGQNQFRGMAYGQTRPGLSLIDVSNARVAFPPSSERNTISDVGKSLHRAIEETKTEQNRLRSLKASTADALLTGRVRVAS